MRPAHPQHTLGQFNRQRGAPRDPRYTWFPWVMADAFIEECAFWWGRGYNVLDALVLNETLFGTSSVLVLQVFFSSIVFVQVV